VSLVCYTVGIINWRKDELEAMDRKTRKMMTIYNSIHPRADMDRLYIPRKHGGRGLISKQESINMEQQSLSRYIDVSKQELLAANSRENILNDCNGEDNKQLKHSLMQEHKEKWMTKPLHGQFLRQTTKRRLKELGLANNRWAKERNRRISHGTSRSSTMN